METNKGKHYRAFNPYVACIQVNTYDRDKQEERILENRRRGVSVSENVSDGGQDHNIRYGAPETRVMQSS